MDHFCAITTLAAFLLRAQIAPAVSTEIPFEFREGLIWIQARISHSTNQLNFLLDTGAGISVINRGTADGLGLKLGSPIEVRGVASTFTGYRLKNISASADAASLPAEYIAVDLSKLSSSCGRSVDGLLGADFFRGRIVQIDFKEQEIRIVSDILILQQPDTLPLQIRPCGIRIPITVNGQKRQWVRLDTGCATPLQLVTTRVRPQDCNPKVAIGLTEVSIPQAQTIVEIGHEKFENVPTGLHQRPIFAGEAGLLGNGLLCRFSRITIDTKSCRLFLER